MSTTRLSSAAAILLLAGGGAAAVAAEFDEADIFLELNATDRDVGVYVSLDAESWRELRIEGPGGQRVIGVSPRGNLGRIGLTELFFEGEEPSLGEVPFARFRSLVPTGTYTFLGRTTEGEPLRSTEPLSAELPCPAAFLEAARRSPGAAFTVEALAIEDTGNKTITEQGFRVE
jgi:hypothetical protein